MHAQTLPPPRPYQVTELAGYTSRVSEMLQVFQDIQQGHYVVTPASCEPGGVVNGGGARWVGSMVNSFKILVCYPVASGEGVKEGEEGGRVPKKVYHPQSSGEVIESDDIIVLEHVPIVTPNMDTVVADLSLEVKMDGGLQ